LIEIDKNIKNWNRFIRKNKFW